MPLSYRGAAEEHRAVRERCGLFDVSHMGEIELRGPAAAAVCQELTVNDVRRLRIGDGQYTLFCNQRGGVLDDLIVVRLGAERYLLVVNAANTATDYAWVRARAGERAEVVDRSAELALLALQGPEAERALRTLTALDLAALRPFTALEGPVAGVRTLVSRTGYTGEDGFELLVAASDAPRLWEAVLDATRRRDGLPAGLGARDTLRLEAGLPLCGTDMDETTTPLEAGLAWVVKLDKGDFVGRAVLAEQAARGVARRLVGLELAEPGVPRHGYAVFVELPAVGATFAQGQVFGVVESNKTVSDLFAPVNGRVIAVNQVLRDEPEHVNADPYGAGWMIRLAVARRDEVDALLDAAGYRAHIAREQAK